MSDVSGVTSCRSVSTLVTILLHMWTCHTKPVGNERERRKADDSLSIVESTEVHLYVCKIG